MGKRVEVADTNIWVRYLTGDNEDQLKTIRQAFMETKEGKRLMIVKPLIVAETCFVLESSYKMTREKIGTAFEVVLSQKWLKVIERKILLIAIRDYMNGIHFADAYISAYAKAEGAEIFSFDKKLMKSFLGSK